MAMATATRASGVDVIIYGRGTRAVRKLEGASVLSRRARLSSSVGAVGHATFGHTAIARWFDPKRHRRVVLFTDTVGGDRACEIRFCVGAAGYSCAAWPELTRRPWRASAWRHGRAATSTPRAGCSTTTSRSSGPWGRPRRRRVHRRRTRPEADRLGHRAAAGLRRRRERLHHLRPRDDDSGRFDPVRGLVPGPRRQDHVRACVLRRATAHAIAGA